MCLIFFFYFVRACVVYIQMQNYCFPCKLLKVLSRVIFVAEQTYSREDLRCCQVVACRWLCSWPPLVAAIMYTASVWRANVRLGPGSRGLKVFIASIARTMKNNSQYYNHRWNLLMYWSCDSCDSSWLVNVCICQHIDQLPSRQQERFTQCLPCFLILEILP